MSLLSAILLPQIEKQLVALEPQIAAFVLRQMHIMGNEFVAYVEEKMNPLPPVIPPVVASNENAA